MGDSVSFGNWGWDISWVWDKVRIEQILFLTTEIWSNHVYFSFSLFVWFVIGSYSPCEIWSLLAHMLRVFNFICLDYFLVKLHFFLLSGLNGSIWYTYRCTSTCTQKCRHIVSIHLGLHVYLCKFLSIWIVHVYTHLQVSSFVYDFFIQPSYI